MSETVSEIGADAAQQDRAAAKLARAEQQERERAQVWTEMADRARQVDDNTARLRALRLERERLAAAAEAEAAPRTKARAAKPAAKAVGAKTVATKAKATTARTSAAKAGARKAVGAQH